MSIIKNNWGQNKIFSKAAVGQINKNLIIELFITFLAQGINEFF